MAGRATLKPGETTEIVATMKTAGHVGKQTKTINVETSDPNNPIIQLMFMADIFEATPVPGEEKTPIASALFKENCATCHAAPVQGKTKPEEIYSAACFMCHGDLPGVPPVAAVTPSAKIGPVGLRDQGTIKKIIYDGIPRTEMPPFGKQWQGPLTDEQIEALAAFIASRPASPPRPFRVEPGAASQPAGALPPGHPN